MAMNAKPEMTITVDDVDQITIESRGLRSGTTTITFNEEFEERTADGRDVVVSLFTLSELIDQEPIIKNALYSIRASTLSKTINGFRRSAGMVKRSLTSARSSMMSLLRYVLYNT